MRRTVICVGLLSLVLVWLAAAAPKSAVRHTTPVMLTGLEDVAASTHPAVPFRGPVLGTLDDEIGPIDTVGWTYYDTQQNGTMGKQVAVDRNNWVHAAWTRGVNAGSSQRHVYYNAWNPDLQQFVTPDTATPVGTQVDNAPRGGFCSITVSNNGIAFPAFHQTYNGTPHAAVAYDYSPHFGAFATEHMTDPPGNAQIIWPHSAIDRTNKIHLVMTESEGASQDYYCQAVPDIEGESCNGMGFPNPWVQWDTHATFITMDVATSWQSDRVAVAWLSDPLGDEISINTMLQVSEDGGMNWGQPINITNFPDIDTNCVRNGGELIECNQDSMRPWIDCAVIFDELDNIHVAFSATASMFWSLDDSTRGPWTWNTRPSNIWHWDEVNQEFNIVAERWYGYGNSLGTNMLMCHRPSFALDTTTGYLYCSFQMQDTSEYNETTGYLSADAYITVSTDHGRNWAEPTNVSNTHAAVVPTPDGQSLVERDITVAQFVSQGVVHMQYMIDFDPGTFIAATPEGVQTHNPMIYQRVPVELIPTAPLLEPRPLRFDSTGFPGRQPDAADERPALRAGEFALYQNYPNPFNPSTQIQFDLSAESVVSLRVFDVLGREVAVLLNGQRMPAGSQVVSFNGADLASGVYFYELETPLAKQVRKMVLMK